MAQSSFLQFQRKINTKNLACYLKLVCFVTHSITTVLNPRPKDVISLKSCVRWQSVEKTLLFSIFYSLNFFLFLFFRNKFLSVIVQLLLTEKVFYISSSVDVLMKKYLSIYFSKVKTLCFAFIFQRHFGLVKNSRLIVFFWVLLFSFSPP